MALPHNFFPSHAYFLKKFDICFFIFDFGITPPIKTGVCFSAFQFLVWLLSQCPDQNQTLKLGVTSNMKRRQDMTEILMSRGGSVKKTLSTPEDIRKFSSDYLVNERLVRDHVTHLDNLKLKSDKRKAETRRRKERSAVAAAEEEVDEQEQR